MCHRVGAYGLEIPAGVLGPQIGFGVRDADVGQPHPHLYGRVLGGVEGDVSARGAARNAHVLGEDILAQPGAVTGEITVELHHEVDLKARAGSAESARGGRTLEPIRRNDLKAAVANSGRAATGVNEEAGIADRRIGEPGEAGAGGRGELHLNAIVAQPHRVVAGRGDLGILQIARGVIRPVGPR